MAAWSPLGDGGSSLPLPADDGRDTGLLDSPLSAPMLVGGRCPSADSPCARHTKGVGCCAGGGACDVRAGRCGAAKGVALWERATIDGGGVYLEEEEEEEEEEGHGWGRHGAFGYGACSSRRA